MCWSQTTNSPLVLSPPSTASPQTQLSLFFLSMFGLIHLPTLFLLCLQPQSDRSTDILASHTQAPCNSDSLEWSRVSSPLLKRFQTTMARCSQSKSWAHDLVPCFSSPLPGPRSQEVTLVLHVQIQRPFVPSTVFSWPLSWLLSVPGQGTSSYQLLHSQLAETLLGD